MTLVGKLWGFAPRREPRQTEVKVWTTEDLRKLSEIEGLERYITFDVKVVYKPQSEEKGEEYNVHYRFGIIGWQAELEPKNTQYYRTVEDAVAATMDGERKNIGGDVVIIPKEKISLSQI